MSSRTFFLLTANQLAGNFQYDFNRERLIFQLETYGSFEFKVIILIISAVANAFIFEIGNYFANGVSEGEINRYVRCELFSIKFALADQSYC